MCKSRNGVLGGATPNKLTTVQEKYLIGTLPANSKRIAPRERRSPCGSPAGGMRRLAAEVGVTGEAVRVFLQKFQESGCVGNLENLQITMMALRRKSIRSGRRFW